MKGQICILAFLFLIQLGVCAANQLQQLEKMVEKLQVTVMSVTIENAKLQDAVLFVTKENAKYAELVEDLIEKVTYQERRIWILEKDCNINNSIYPEVKTNKTSDKQINEKDNSFDEAIYKKNRLSLDKLCKRHQKDDQSNLGMVRGIQNNLFLCKMKEIETGNTFLLQALNVAL